MVQQPTAVVRKNYLQLPVSTNEDYWIPWAEGFQTGDELEVGQDGITIPETGLYLVTFRMYASGAPADTQVKAWVNADRFGPGFTDVGSEWEVTNGLYLNAVDQAVVDIVPAGVLSMRVETSMESELTASFRLTATRLATEITAPISTDSYAAL